MTLGTQCAMYGCHDDGTRTVPYTFSHFGEMLKTTVRLCPVHQQRWLSAGPVEKDQTPPK